MDGPLERGRWEGQRAARAIALELLLTGFLTPLTGRGHARYRPHPNGRRFLIIHLDGISRDVMRRATEEERMPFLASLLGHGRFVLSPLRSCAPPSTPAFQAGLLYGIDRPDIPGFQWFDRARKTVVRMDRAEDAARVEAELRRTGRGLLEGGGANYFGMFQGGAETDLLCLVGWKTRPSFELGFNGYDYLASMLAHAFSLLRMVRRLPGETARALLDVMERIGKTGKVAHELRFLIHRLALTVLAREYASHGLVMEVARGVPSIYVCFTEYDEICHRRGPDHPTAQRALGELDRTLERVISAALASPDKAYDIYILADHGHAACDPFELIFGLPLGEALDGHGGLQRRALSAPMPPDPRRRIQRLPLARLLRAAVREIAGAPRSGGRLVVIESGNLAHVYWPSSRPLTLGELQARDAEGLRTVLRCPGVSLVGVRGASRGLAFVDGRLVDLADERACGCLGFGYGGPRIAHYISEVLAMPSAGDLVLFASGCEGEGLAYAWEFGSHGSVSRAELETFLIHPREVAVPDSARKGPAALHRFLRAHYSAASSEIGRYPSLASAAGVPSFRGRRDS